MRSAIWSDTKPPPDRSLQPLLEEQNLVSISYSANGERRAVITRDPRGAFRVLIEIWDTCGSVTEGARYVSDWSLRDSSLTDNLLNAELIAQGLLSNEPENA